MTRPAFPDGHFYSPVVDTEEALRDRAAIWPPAQNPGPLAEMMKVAPVEPTVHGIDWSAASHEYLLRRQFPALIKGYDYPSTGPADDALEQYHEGNSQFGFADAKVLFCMLRMLQPRRIVEVGSGYSTLLMADVNARFLGGQTSITCVEPYPRPFLRRLHERGEIDLLEKRAQEAAGDVFDSLQAGDILFIDSSHVSKTGSDVNRLILDVLPSLKPGVVIHVHDIFFPNDYPESWVVENGFSWNEQYLLQAMLIGNPNFEVIYGGSLARAFHRLAMVDFLGKMTHGSSFWMRRVAA